MGLNLLQLIQEKSDLLPSESSEKDTDLIMADYRPIQSPLCTELTFSIILGDNYHPQHCVHAVLNILVWKH